VAFDISGIRSFLRWDFHVCSAKNHFLSTTSLKFYTALKGFISSVVKNVATSGLLLLPNRRNPRSNSNPPGKRINVRRSPCKRSRLGGNPQEPLFLS